MNVLNRLTRKRHCFAIVRNDNVTVLITFILVIRSLILNLNSIDSYSRIFNLERILRFSLLRGLFYFAQYTRTGIITKGIPWWYNLLCAAKVV